MKQWITFDLDGTLMQNPFGAWIFPEVEQVLAEELQSSPNIKSRLYAIHEQYMKEQSVAAYDWDGMLQTVMKELGAATSIDLEQLVIKHSHMPKIYVLDDSVLPTLTRLKEQGYAIAAITNGYYKYQYPVVQALGLMDLLDELVTPERVGFAKPNIRMADELLNRGQIVAHVGDRLDHDIYFANELGVKSVLIHRGMNESLLCLSPEERPHSDSFRLLMKRIAEHEKLDLSDKEQVVRHMPQYVISSLDELISFI